ncbi:universal stress protein [Haliscomenobacter hydrossis]|uniref:UspA domain-containing protein n=1 Tax=Haliscomenobacter hydrossis (strain ATCC 27775 / DSM 1100 / LMG 10767 / O) TaxID=760192 RepID=F4KVS1_HALH1|nr:universal stress protein [Haliscomenobacter hydrossis]AEE53496.1 UspA domain-containing protein [Haliscomenobacter hydrossis DSM 1100]
MRKIKNIIVPTDFSVTARNAYQYAQGLAQVLGASITVVHVKEHFIPVSELNIAPFFENEEIQLAEAMVMFVAEEQAANDGTIVKSKIKTQILRGDPTGSLIELSADPDTDLMVIGTTGLQDVISKAMGSISGTVASKASCPVILVPPLAEWVPIERMLYASNYESMAPGLIGEATDFARFFLADTHFVHVDDTVFEEKSKTDGVSWDKLFSMIDPKLSYQTHAIYGSNTIEELKKYAEKHHIDLMVFVSKHRSFWENLFHQSTTQNMAVSTDIPMMVLHLDDKS